MDLMSVAHLLGNFGEFVGSIAVVVTLGYLAVQVRHNAQSAAVSRGNAALTQFATLHETIMENENLAELVAPCRSSDLPDLSPGDEERIQRIAAISVVFWLSIPRWHR